jgi:hypothetical protein
VLIPIAAGTIGDAVALSAIALRPSLARIAAPELLERVAEAEAPSKTKLALTDWPPIVAIKPTASVAVIPTGGVMTAENDPLASVVP